jgi:O-antigen/teichoic acid export membrane protein
LNWALSDQALVSGANFVTGILIARFLGIEEFGHFTLAWLVLEFALNIHGAMIITPMQSISAKYSGENSQRYFGSLITSQITLGVTCGILLYFSVLAFDHLFLENKYSNLALPMAVALLALGVQYFMRRYAFTRDAPLAAFASDFLRYALQLGGLLWMFKSNDLDPGHALLVISLAALISLLPGMGLFWPVKLNREVLTQMLRRHWDFSKWLIPSIMLTWTLYNLFMAAAGAMLGAAAVGGIRAAQNIVAISHILILGLENIVPIMAARHFARDGSAGLTRYLLRFTFFGALAMGLIIVAVSIAPDYLLHVIYGDEFKGQGYLVRWWCAIYLFEFLAIPAQMGLRTIEDTRPIFLQNLYLSGFSMLICYPLIATFDKIGVMVGLTALAGLKCAILTFYFRKRVRGL